MRLARIFLLHLFALAMLATTTTAMEGGESGSAADFADLTWHGSPSTTQEEGDSSRPHNVPALDYGDTVLQWCNLFGTESEREKWPEEGQKLFKKWFHTASTLKDVWDSVEWHHIVAIDEAKDRIAKEKAAGRGKIERAPHGEYDPNTKSRRDVQRASKLKGMVENAAAFAREEAHMRASLLAWVGRWKKAHGTQSSEGREAAAVDWIEELSKARITANEERESDDEVAERHGHGSGAHNDTGDITQDVDLSQPLLGTSKAEKGKGKASGSGSSRWRKIFKGKP